MNKYIVDNYAYKTKHGYSIYDDSLKVLGELSNNSIDLVITSPPFALLRKKAYGNKDQHEYVEWLGKFAEQIKSKLKDTGSLVIDLGGAYQTGLPVRSLYNYEVLIHFCNELKYYLAEEFFWFNPSKLPSPIEWVNKRKIRVKDSVNTIWWFSKTPYPKSNVNNVLVPYSDRMLKLIEDPENFYKPDTRPSGHEISKSFGKDNGGAIPSNLLQISNSESNSVYLSWCKKMSIKGHPARFPSKLPEFFIKLLTEESDLVVDIFAGSNTTGQVSEELKRKWISIDNDLEYIASSAFRFIPKNISLDKVQTIYFSIKNGEKCNFEEVYKNFLMA